MEGKTSLTTILSLRLSASERRLVEEAAQTKGWKPAKFLRVSALERAAHVLNLSRPTSFDFSAAAKRLAEALLAARDVSLVDADLAEHWGRFGPGPIEFPQSDKVKLDAVRLDDFRPAPLTQEEVD